MANGYRVPRLMWESFETALNLAGKQFVKQLAKSLEVPEKDLLREVFERDDIKVCIHDWTDEDFMCPGQIAVNGVYCPCERAKICGKETCGEHVGWIEKKQESVLAIIDEFCFEEGCDSIGHSADSDLGYLPEYLNLVISKEDLIEYIGSNNPRLENLIGKAKGFLEDGVLRLI